MYNADWSKWNSKEDNFKKYSHIKSNLIYGTPQEKTNLVSVMIITYKRARGLKNALDSAINQNYLGSYEIAVVDDSGFDQATDDLMKEYCNNHENIVYYRHEQNLGQYANWNRACELCSTEWFCLLHDDDTMARNYLTATVKTLQDKRFKNIGLLGVYYKTIDNRKTVNEKTSSKKILNFLTTAFIKIRKNKPILINLEDNIKLIYVLSCCLMVNKNKVLEIGGLDDLFFPSSDFVLSSKMNYYYSTAFTPQYLSFRGIGENESLKPEVCEDSIKCAYYHTLAMLDTIVPDLPQSEKQKKASFAAVAAELGVIGYNNIDYGKTKTLLGMKPKYNNKFIRNMIMLKSRFAWGALLFRK